MRRPRWLLVVLVSAVAAGASPLVETEPLERNRRLLEKWRADPDHYQRLQRDLRAFYALPAEKQHRLRELDRYLHDGDEAAQARRWAVVERYTSWLEALPDSERRQVLQAATPADRLAAIRAIRERQWLGRLPRGLRDELDKLPPDRRAARIAALRREEKQQRREWQGLGPAGDAIRPVSLSQFPKDVQEFVSHELQPRLSEREKEELRQANGKWPDLANAIHRLAGRHPVLPPLPSGKIVMMSELPPSFRKMLPRDKAKAKGKGAFRQPKEVKQAAGKWPDFAMAATKWYRDTHRDKVPPPLGASRPGELPRDAQVYVKSRLMPQVTAQQREELRRLEGRWPEYPRRLHELARQRFLVIPGMSLPGPRELWHHARAAAPDVPGHVLWQFAQKELTPRDWSELGLRPDDPLGNREKVKREYLRREKQRKGGRAGPGKGPFGALP